ncbi:GL15351 [Drosophila persimilis]|uniref:GL15351 n=1 Tax=Drosophila persimilis TaxID=7234 RepID=B4HD42_DROPE|nr:GL15351 [Drosophila persimilis]
MATARRGTTPGGTATPAAEAVGNPPVTGRFVGGYWLRSLKAVPSTSTSRTLRGCVPRASGPHIRQNRRAPLHPRTVPPMEHLRRICSSHHILLTYTLAILVGVLATLLYVALRSSNQFHCKDLHSNTERGNDLHFTRYTTHDTDACLSSIEDCLE